MLVAPSLISTPISQFTGTSNSARLTHDAEGSQKKDVALERGLETIGVKGDKYDSGDFIFNTILYGQIAKLMSEISIKNTFIMINIIWFD